MQRLLRAGVIQAKLSVGQPNDPYEQEADRVADSVMGTSGPQLQRACACGGECPKCRTQPDQGQVRLQTKHVQSSEPGETEAPSAVDDVLRSSGQPLDPATRGFMESRFGHDFGQVRIHNDEQAARSARLVDARAYTVGRNVVVGAGEYAPGTSEGNRLLAHELAHVVQQAQGGAGLLQRQPEAVPHCTGVDIAGKRITLHCDGRDFTGIAAHDLPPGTFELQYKNGQFVIGVVVDPSSPLKVLSVNWNVKGTKEVAELRRHLGSLKGQHLKLSVAGSGTGGSLATPDPEAEIQGGSSKKTTGSGSGAGAGTGQKATGEPGGGQGTGSGSGTGTTQQVPGTTQQGTGSGSGTGTTPQAPGTTQQGQESTGSGPGAYPAKLQSLLDAAQVQKLTDEQSRQLKVILDQLSPSDIELFKQFSVKNPGGDPERFINSLRLFQSAKSEFEKQHPPSAPPDLADDASKALASAMDQYRDDMSTEQKEQLARSAISTISNKQLKSLTAKQIAEGIIRVDQQVASIADDMSKGIDQVIDADSGWGKAAGAARAAKGAAGWWAFLSFAALIVAQFVPGLNIIVDVMAASALAAGMVMVVAADAEREFNTKAAAGAKSPAEFQKYIVGGAEARTQEIIGGAGLALSALGGIVKGTPLGRGIANVSKKLNAAKVLLNQRAASSLAAAKTMALETLEQLKVDLQPFAAQARQIIDAAVKRLKNLKGADFLKEAKNIPELQGLFPPDQLKTMEALSPSGLEAAKTEILADLATSGDEFFRSMDSQVSALKSKIQNANTVEELAAALDEGLKAMDPMDPLALQTAGAETKTKVVQSRIGQLEPGGQTTATAQIDAPTTQPAGQTQSPVQPPAGRTEPPPKPVATQTRPPAKASTQKRPGVKKQGSQDLDPQRRVKATERKEGLEKKLEDLPADQAQRVRDIKEIQKELELLKAQKKKLPEALRNDKDFAKLPRLGDETAIDNRLEALEVLRQKLEKANKLTPEIADYLDWEKKRLTLEREIQGGKEANVVDDTQIKDIKDVTLPAAEDEVRKASQTIKRLVEQRGPNFRAKKGVGYDEIMGKERWEKLQATREKVVRTKEGKIIDPLDTDHLFSLDAIANLPELAEFLKVFAKASKAIKDKMIEDLGTLGDIPANLKRMRYDANEGWKSNRSWHELDYAEAKKFGYEAADVDAMRAAENEAMKTILDEIDKLTTKYRDLTTSK